MNNPTTADWQKQKPAHPMVAAANAAVATSLPFADTQDFDDAARGFIDTIPDATIMGANGRVVWSLAPYAFLADDTAPPTVNPSLWRQSRLNMNHGLFKVVDGLYQVRGFDIANMTIVETASKIIVIDTLTSIEGARAALALYAKHRGQRPVAAIIFTHTHTDHWGGARGVVSDADVQSGAVAVIAPDLFMEHAVSENVIAGNAMLRRAQYQFGPLAPKGPRGQIDCGLGKSMAAGSVSLMQPTDLIKTTGDRRTIDGVELVFQMAPETEAPAEMHIYLPQMKALNLAENATHNVHNLLPFRGSLVRDAFVWSHYINEAIALWGGEAEVLLGQHHWPVWGNARVNTYLGQQRDTYKYTHDQTLRLLNHGLNAAEIAEQIAMPPSLDEAWHTRGYYGHVRHNAKAVYQRYLGWYDGNPANLDPLPPVETGKKMLEYLGGADVAVARATADFAKGEFRFVAQIMSQVLFGEPTHQGARALLADSFEQLAYLTESANWRNAYVTGAMELRHGLPNVPARTPISPDTIKALKTPQFFDYLAVRVNGEKAAGLRFAINWHFPDTGEQHILNLDNATLTHRPGHSATARTSLTLDRTTLNQFIQRTLTFPDGIASGQIKLTGDPQPLADLMNSLDEFQRMFHLAEPRTRPTRT